MILVMAATGMFGRQVVQALAQQGVPVRATGRSLASLEPLRAPGVELMAADMDDPASLQPLMQGVDRVLVNAPMDGRKQQRECHVIEAMVRAGAQAQAVLLTGGVEHNDALGDAGRAVEQAMRDSQLPWTTVGPQTVMESNFYPFRDLIVSDSLLLSCVGEAQVGFVALEDVSAAFAAVLTAPVELHHGRDYVITGPQAVSFTAVAEAASAALGRPIRYQDMPRQAFVDLLLNEAGYDPATLEIEVMCHLDAFRAGQASRITTDFRQLTGRNPTSVAQWWQANAAYFLS